MANQGNQPLNIAVVQNNSEAGHRGWVLNTVTADEWTAEFRLVDDHTDADPYLLRAARHHGEATERPCPICRTEELVHVTYVFGDELGPFSGRVKSSAELPVMAYEHGHFRVYVVEVCTDCGWNHMITAFLLGDGVTRRPPRRQKTVEDIYG